jgi:hypothetical protein
MSNIPYFDLELSPNELLIHAVETDNLEDAEMALQAGATNLDDALLIISSRDLDEVQDHQYHIAGRIFGRVRNPDLMQSILNKSLILLLTQCTSSNMWENLIELIEDTLGPLQAAMRVFHVLEREKLEFIMVEHGFLEVLEGEGDAHNLFCALDRLRNDGLIRASLIVHIATLYGEIEFVRSFVHHIDDRERLLDTLRIAQDENEEIYDLLLEYITHLIRIGVVAPGFFVRVVAPGIFVRLATLENDTDFVRQFIELTDKDDIEYLKSSMEIAEYNENEEIYNLLDERIIILQGVDQYVFQMILNSQY